MSSTAISRRLGAALGLLALCLLYLTFLGRAGLLLPDEPRYAAIGQAMADSGDWITPRLWGHAWFEKPPLIYWMAALFFRLGFGPEWAPRLPVALLSVGFLIFLFRTTRRVSGEKAAWIAASVLATSAGWFAFGHAAVTDMPLAVFFSAAMLMAYDGRRTAAGILLGLAILAKALVPLVLFIPAIWFLRRRWRDLIWIPGIGVAVALPWFALCYARNGMPFLEDLIWKQHFARFATGTLQHVQPFWYYAPVLAAGLFPWTPLLALLVGKEIYRERRRAFLAGWFVFGFVFFSLSRNKLPGYLLPLLPPVAILVGERLARVRRPVWFVAACGALACLAPAINRLLPRAIEAGATHVDWRAPAWVFAACVVAGGIIAVVGRAGRRGIAFAIPVALILAAYGQFIWVDLPVLDRVASGRRIWREELSKEANPSVLNQNRIVRYGICYYAGGHAAGCELQ